MITNPRWKRQINIAKVRIDLMKMKLQMEFNDGKANSQTIRQPVRNSEGVRNQPAINNESERGNIIDSGADA